MESHLRQDVRSSPEQAIAAIGEAAEMWNAAWQAAPSGGRLHLPVLAGIRRGRVLADVDVVATGSGCEIGLRIEHAEYEINRPALVFLVLGALGGLVTVIWPLFPNQMINFLPLAVVFLLGSWLLVASRLRTAAPQDFLDTVAEMAEDAAHGEPESA